MLSFFKEWAIGVCFTFMSCAVIYAIVPSTSTKKAVRIVCAVLIIAAFIYPFKDADFNIPIDLFNESISFSEDKEQSSSAYIISAAFSDEITERIDEILTESGFPNCEINVLTDISDDYRISIKRADIKMPNGKTATEEIEKKLYDALGEDTIIVFS